MRPFPTVFMFGCYIVVVCGSLSFLRAPKSFDVLFPTGMNGFVLSVLLLTLLLVFTVDVPSIFGVVEAL